MRKCAWLLLCGGIVGLSLSLQAQQQTADLILTNGKIITVNDTFQIAQAVAVKGARIIAVGSNADIQKLAGPNTNRIDLKGKSVVPGFIDNHAHFQEEGAYWTMELRFDGMDTRKKVL
jgi:predicted amidohydrolase YtcJ